MTTATCPECGEDVGLTPAAGKLRSHKVPASFDETRPKCPGSGTLPTEESCDETTGPDTANSATCSSTSDIGAPLSETPPNTSKSDTSRTTQKNRPVETLPGVDQYAEELDQLRKLFDPPKPWPFDQPAAQPVEQPTLFSQPSQAGRGPKVWSETKPMTPLGAEIAARLKEMFHGYSNRMERNQQQTLGPSEIGSPCDRRLALSLLRYPTVNPGGDNWASFVGTCIHTGLEKMLMWANAGSGRYAAEVRLTFPSKHVPKGTTDAIDRTMCVVMDHKAMGQWSLDKLKTEGPSRTYRVQAHVYALGAKLNGERIRDVAIIGWPRDKSSLDDLYVWTEPYNGDLARESLKRVDRIAAKLKGCTETLGLHSDGCGCPDTVRIAYEMPYDNSDCRFCPFYMRNAGESKGGICNGKG